MPAAEDPWPALVDAVYGPRCSSCAGRRTRNPSRVCSPCLGRACCPDCGGQGWKTSRLDGFPTGCGRCGGTGKI